MNIVLRCAAILMIVLAIACGGSDGANNAEVPISKSASSKTAKPGATVAPDRLALLEEAAMETGIAIAEKDWATLYLSYPEAFRDKCPAPDFLAMWTFIEVFGEMPDGLAFTLHRVWIEGDLGYVEGTWSKDGVAWGEDSEGEPDPAFTWIDGAWITWVSPEEMEKDNPCEITFE